MSVADKTPELPSNRRRLSAWLQERLFERRIVLVAGRPDKTASYSRQHQELLWRLHARLAHLTRRPAEKIAEDMRRGRYLDATEALVYGLIDEIRGPR